MYPDIKKTKDLQGQDMSLEDSTKLDALFYQYASREGSEKDIESYQEDLKQFSDQEDIKEKFPSIIEKIIEYID